MMLAALCLCASAAQSVAQTFTSVFSFDGSDGSTPQGLVQGTDGNLYGTTQATDGTVFKITPSGTLTALLTFNGLNDDGGGSPAAVLVRGTDGNFYGTNSSGGVNEGNCQYDCGTHPWGTEFSHCDPLGARGIFARLSDR